MSDRPGSPDHNAKTTNRLSFGSFVFERRSANRPLVVAEPFERP